MSLPPLIGQPATSFYRTFFRGLVVVLPIAVTLAVVLWLATIFEVILGGLVKLFIPAESYTSGLGLLVGIVLIFAVGATMETWISRRLLAHAESLMDRIPVIKSIYGTVRDLAAAFEKKGSKERFQSVVMVSITHNTRLVGFVTCENTLELTGENSESDEIIGVYLPMSYQIGGYTIFVPRSSVRRINMSTEDAMRFVLTAGISNSTGQVPPPGANDRSRASKSIET